ncbi:O-methyltransferase [Azospirillum endophyticum]
MAGTESTSEMQLEIAPRGEFAWIVKDVPAVLPDEPGDDMVDSERSRLVVLEDGVPLRMAHVPHYDIQSLGAGRYSHWHDYLVFSTSDNTSPFTNGRLYEVAAGNRRLPLTPAPWVTEPHKAGLDARLKRRREIVSEVNEWLRYAEGHCWRIDLRGLVRHHGLELPAAPPPDLEVLEDGNRLEGERRFEELRAGTAGWRAEWPFLLLCANGGGNVKLNNRHYTIRLEGRELAVPRALQAHALGVPRPPDPDLVSLVSAAYRRGCSLSLAPMQRNGDAPYDYYRFLAGLMQGLECRRVVEIGTEFGESALAMAQGMGGSGELLVTIDLIDRIGEFNPPPMVKRIVGDAAAPATIRRVLDLCDGRPIDVLFVDSAHHYAETIAHFSIYAVLLRPKLVILDDIVLSETMAMLWADLLRTYGGAAINASDVEPNIRTPECGFGLLDLRRHWLPVATGQ